MAIYIPIPEPIEVFRWFKNGDIPGDGVINNINSGAIVGRHNTWTVNNFTSGMLCPKCNKPIGNHGVIPEALRIEELEFVVCPGDWVNVKRNNNKRIVKASVITDKKLHQYYINMNSIQIPKKES